MVEQIDNVSLLKEFLKSSNYSFLRKIHLLLEYSFNHPDQINQTGCFWADDYEILCINSRIAGNIFDLKANSLNKNFALYGIKKFHGRTICNERYASKIDKSKWYYRKSENFQFTRETTSYELKNIRMYSPNKQPKTPPQVVNLISQESQDTLIFPSMDKLKWRNNWWKRTMKNNFMKYFENFNQESNSIKLEDIYKFYVQYQVDEKTLSKIETLLEFFAKDDERIDIDSLFVFSCFFGVGLSSIEIIKNFPLSIKHDISFLLSDSENDWLTLVKLSPSLIGLFKNQPTWTWILAVSDEPGLFTLIIKVEQYTTEAQIYFDAISNVYLFSTQNGESETFNTINEIIFGYAELSKDCILNLNQQIQKVELPIDLIQNDPILICD